MNLRFLQFCVRFTLLPALLAQCLALPSALSPRADKCNEGFKVIIYNNRTKDPAQNQAGEKPSQPNVYVSGQVDGKYGMLVWKGTETKWHPLTAPDGTSVSVHEKITPPEGASLAGTINGEKIEFCMPKNVISGRVYIVEGTLEFKTFLSGGKTLVDEPSAVAEGTDAYSKRWSFLEFTYDGDHIVVNLSFVDWVSLSLGFTLKTSQATHQVPGLEPGGLDKVCEELKTQSKADGLPDWEKLCVRSKDSKQLLRVLSPNQYATLQPGAWKGYYDGYWDAFSKQTKEKQFVINTQDENGKKVAEGARITCTMPDQALLCNSTTTPPEQFEIGPPQAITEIWGCNGGMFDTGRYTASQEAHKQYLEILPRLCAAMVRSTLLLDGGHIQPNDNIQPDKYYLPNKNETKWPTNHYSRIVHQFLKENKGYAFAYDDVGPGDVDSAGLIDTHNPETWEITLSD